MRNFTPSLIPKLHIYNVNMQSLRKYSWCNFNFGVQRSEVGVSVTVVCS